MLSYLELHNGLNYINKTISLFCCVGLCLLLIPGSSVLQKRYKIDADGHSGSM